MPNLKPRVVLITGCSSGFGFLTALKFARHGWQVWASVRKMGVGAQELKNIAKTENLNLRVIKIDVTDDVEIKTAVTQILRIVGRIDLLINNAGFGYLGPIEEFLVEEVQKLYDANIFGPLRTMQAVLPTMRRQKSGRIINISSVNGLLAFGLYGIYSSSKFALETISESLRFEVKPFGVDVVIIEPGSFITEFSQNIKLAKKYVSSATAYGGLKDPLSRISAQNHLKQNQWVKKIVDPQKVADKLYQIANLDKTKIRYKIGFDTHLYTLIRKIVPDSIWEKILHRAYRW